MKVLLALILLLLLGLGAASRRRLRLPGSRALTLVGAEFLLLGWALGEQGLGFLDAALLGDLEPLVILGLGWIGLLVGLQFEAALLRRVPLGFYGAGLGQGLITMALLYLPLQALLAQLFGPGPGSSGAAFFLAAAGADSSQHLLTLALRERRGVAPASAPLFRFCAEIDTLIPLLALPMLAGLLHARAWLGTPAAGAGPALRGLGLAALLGLVLGLLLTLLLKGTRRPAHHLLVLLGFLALSGGLAQVLGQPPLFVNFVAGVVTVNLLGHRADTWRLAAASERPFYTIFLLLVGAGWHLGSRWALLVAVAFFVLRVAAKVLALAFAGRLAWRRSRLPLGAGLALSGQSGVSVAMVASLQSLERSTLADASMSILLIGFLLSALIAPWLTRQGLSPGQPT